MLAYGVSITTLEDVFMKVGMLEEEEEEEEQSDRGFDPSDKDDDSDVSYEEIQPFSPRKAKLSSNKKRNWSIRQSVRNARASYVSVSNPKKRKNERSEEQTIL